MTRSPWASQNDPRIEEARVQEQMQRPDAARCPYCDRVMSRREAVEQAACNDCNGGAYDPRDAERSYIYRGIE